MSPRSLATPWAHAAALYSSPSSLILKLALGEAPDDVPVGTDVRARVLDAPDSLGVGSIDRVLDHFSGDRQVTRLYSAAAARRPGLRHRGYDHLEQTTGLARTFRIDVEPGAPIADIVDALRQVAQAESVSPEYISILPFAAPASSIDREALSYEESWQPRDQVNASQAAAYETGDAAVILAIVDTGVMADHRELRGRMRQGLDTVRLTSSDVAHGIDLVGDHEGIDTDTSDEVGHGTSCAAIAAASGDEIPPGMANGCGVLPMRVLGAARFPGKTNRVGIGGLSDIDSGMKRAVDIGAKVINMSFGTPLSALDPVDPIPHQDIVRYALARGCVLVAASGNSGAEEGFTPAALDGVIAVGAVDPDGVPCRFSTTGHHVALAAPGHRVATATLDGYGLVTGTSFAAPFVAAAAALLVSRAERRAYPMDGAMAARLFKESAVPWPTGRGDGHGAGILDAFGALRLLDEDMDRAPPDDQ
jgi:subtilisin family serine protease